MTHKGKRAKITPIGESIIQSKALETPRRKREEVAEELQLILEGKGHDVPQVEVLERKISKYRKHSTDSPKDKPWSILSLLDSSDNSIPPEALPAVLEVWIYTLENDIPPLTIRQAKWASLLYRVLPPIVDYADLWEHAVFYAGYEKSRERFKLSPLTVAGVGYHQDLKLYRDYCTRAGNALDEERLKRLKSPDVLRKLGLERLSSWPEFREGGEQ